MPRFAVEMMLCRTVTVTVDARSEKAAREAARDRARWLKSEGTRSPLRLLVVMSTTKQGGLTDGYE